MNRRANLVATFVAAVLIGKAAEPAPGVKEEVGLAETAWKDAVLGADRSALEGLMADDVSYTHSSGKTQTKEEFIKEATGGALHYKTIDFEDTKMRQYGNDAVVITHKATIVTDETGTSHLYLTEVWAKVRGHWQLASRHALKLPS